MELGLVKSPNSIILQKSDKGPTIQRVIQTSVAMASNTTDQVLECRQLLANFFHDIKHAHARWFPIVLREGSSKANDHGLSSLMSLDYYSTADDAMWPRRKTMY